MNHVWQSIPEDPKLRQQHPVRDKQLVAAAQRGSSAAFAELQALYSRKLFSRISRITKNREDAEDALQDTFLRAYLSIGNFEGRSNFSSWLTRIAINSALMILRKRRTRAEVFFEFSYGDRDEIPVPERTDKTPNPEQIYLQRQQYFRLANAIQQLEPKLRKPLEIQIADECSLKEIAQALDISVAAVKTRLHRARQRLTRSKSFGYRGARGRLPQISGVTTSHSASSCIEGRHV